MNARQLSIRGGLFLAAVVLFAGCSSLSEPVTPNRFGCGSGFTAGYNNWVKPPVNTLETTMYGWVDSRGRVMYSPTPSQARGPIVSTPMARAAYGGYPTGTTLSCPPMYTEEDLQVMMAEANANWATRCSSGSQPDNLFGNIAGSATVGAVAGVMANGVSGGMAGAVVFGIAGATRAQDYGRYTCQKLLNERDFIRQQRFALEQYRAQQAMQLQMMQQRSWR